MPLFFTKRGYIGGSNAEFTVFSVDSGPCFEDDEKVRTIVTRLLGELLSEME